jgi:Mg/Co/Ni transporter MgtE
MPDARTIALAPRAVKLPLLAARLRIDPAAVSGPVMSTPVDATGLFIYFTVVGVILAL